MKILLDTNFVLLCVKQKVPFVDEVSELGEPLIPLGVIDELKKLGKSKQLSLKERDAADLALKLLDGFKKIELNEKNVDKGILNYALKERIIVATLDKELRRKLKGKARFLVIRGKKSIEVI